jgi:hypothetical protein
VYRTVSNDILLPKVDGWTNLQADKIQTHRLQSMILESDELYSTNVTRIDDSMLILVRSVSVAM